MRAIEVRDSSQVAEARRGAVKMAQSQGFNDEDASRAAIVATELATNLVKHGGGGQLLIGSYDDPTGQGVECIALDQGPGIADIPASMRDGHSTAGSPGTGLGAVFRGSQAFEIYSSPGQGTAILARLQAGQRKARDGIPSYGVINIPVSGEDVCGDSWCRRSLEDGFAVMVADGLGHGPLAADAANAASRIFMQSIRSSPSETLASMHNALKATRGAAVAVAHVDYRTRDIIFAGVGNIAASLIDSQNVVRRMVSNNGTIGHIARHMKNFNYPIESRSLMILSSDGLATSWRLEAYPGLARQHPTLIAAVLYRDFRRGRDDVTVLVCEVDPH